MINNEEFEQRVYYCLYGMDKAQTVTEIRNILYDAFDDFESKPSEQKIRNLLRSWVIRGWCHEITVAEKQGYFYILSGKGTEYLEGKVHHDTHR